MPAWFDHLLVALVLVAAPIDGALERKRLQRDLDAGIPTAKLDAYARIIAWQWGAATFLLVVWMVTGRSFRTLGVESPGGSGFALASAVVLTIAMFLVNQAGMARKNPDFAAKVREAAASLSFITPSTPAELRRFTFLGITAGIVEELICRGYLVWYFASFAPLWLAIVIASIVFGIGHLYQGVAGIIKTGTVGLFFGFLYWLSGSIWVPMFIHAAVDVLQGRLIYFATAGTGLPAAEPVGEGR